VELGRAAQRLAGTDAAGGLRGVMNDEHRDGMASLRFPQIGEQRLAPIITDNSGSAQSGKRSMADKVLGCLGRVDRPTDVIATHWVLRQLQGVGVKAKTWRAVSKNIDWQSLEQDLANLGLEYFPVLGKPKKGAPPEIRHSSEGSWRRVASIATATAHALTVPSAYRHTAAFLSSVHRRCKQSSHCPPGRYIGPECASSRLAMALRTRAVSRLSVSYYCCPSRIGRRP
jgi:hypothetical protein